MRQTDGRRRVLEDLDEPMAESEFAVVADALDAIGAPEPPPGAAAALVERLRTYVPAPPRRRFRHDGGLAASPVLVAAGVLRAQLELFHWGWWAGTALAALALPWAAGLVGAAPALLAPPLVAACLAYAFRELGSPAMEIELTCPVSPVQILIARMLLVLAWTALVGLPPTLLFAQAALLPALAAWGAGLLLFGGGALVLTLWLGVRSGLLLTLLAWAGLLFWRATSVTVLPTWGMSDGKAALLGALLVALALLAPARLRRLPAEEG